MGLDGSLRYLRRESLVSNLMAPPEMSTRCNLIGWVMRKIFSEKLERNIPTSAQTEFLGRSSSRTSRCSNSLQLRKCFALKCWCFRPQFSAKPLVGESSGYELQPSSN